MKTAHPRRSGCAVIAYKTVTHSIIFENEYQIKETINIHRRIVVTF